MSDESGFVTDWVYTSDHQTGVRCRIINQGLLDVLIGLAGSYHCEVLYHATIHPRLMELVFVLWQADVIQPPCKPVPDTY